MSPRLAQTLQAIPPSSDSPPWYFDIWVAPPLGDRQPGDSISVRGIVTDIDSDTLSAGFVASEYLFTGSSAAVPQGVGPELAYIFYQGELPPPVLAPGGSSVYGSIVYPPDEVTLGGVSYPKWTTLVTDPLEVEIPDSGDPFWHHLVLQVIGINAGTVTCLVHSLLE